MVYTTADSYGPCIHPYAQQVEQFFSLLDLQSGATAEIKLITGIELEHLKETPLPPSPPNKSKSSGLTLQEMPHHFEEKIAGIKGAEFKVQIGVLLLCHTEM